MISVYFVAFVFNSPLTIVALSVKPQYEDVLKSKPEWANWAHGFARIGRFHLII